MTDTPTPSQPAAFNNGLSPDQNDALDDAMIDVCRLIARIEDLGRHRSYSLAVTKLEEANFWLRDRKHKPA
jgi:hypothetical protein